ncbi:TonB-dependent receptor [Hymenobacter sp. PAMC 26628]|uniref:TonB-dependent receptor n=1 Tax=Hymenobacter sp. PAMC 26628 TaxID=1484118 RepID=UPI000770360F|nr:TonB-dependent receptor [Hymenobacter sp. PAMC 26628]AMJ66485.1 TonB-dependent receptor [Hymenobacter sp. PAMC 26628]
MNKKLLIVPFVLASSAAWAQSRTLSGQVLDAAGAPVIGATVVEKGTNNGISTDATGRFVLRARTAQPRLQISALGYTSQEVGTEGPVAVRLATSSTALEGVQVVGTRSLNRSVTDSPSPVDIIDVRQVTAKTGQLDVNQLLQFVAPSFNSNRQTGADGADHVDPASLRGLGPDQTLVLVNGKRWHQSALVNLFGSRGRGNTGTDLNTIPAASIERIEILRDGASAQYGSDAIAGVINIVLKTSTKELTANANYGAYTAKYRFDDKTFDGGNFNANANYGVAVGQGGFVNATVDYNQREHTQRANVPAPDGIQRREYGDPKATNTSVYLNSKLPLSEKVYAYVFGGFNVRKGDAYAYTRFPTIGTDSLGNDIPNPRSNATLYPNGFDPIITSSIFDGHGVAGVRGAFGGWDVDLSNGFGSNNFHYGVRNTLNATLGAQSPTTFDAGGFQLQQNVVDLNMSRNYKTVLQGLNLAFGSEYRREWYQIFAGEEGSYRNYAPASNRPGGSQGFPGFQPRNELKASRSNIGVYADAELDVTKALLVEGAVRFENYSDFGSNFTGKLATRLKLSDAFSLRGTLSTGFRAPSLAQINFNTVFTNVVGGKAIDVLIDRNSGPVTRAVGIPPLTRELSRSASVGFTGRAGSILTFTVDGYYIHIQDRIVLTGAFGNDDNIIGPTLTALNVGQAQFFANAASTSTFGLDAVVANTLGVGSGRLTTTLAANFNRLNVTSVQATPLLAGKEDIFFGPREQAFVKASAPPYKINLTFDYSLGRFGALVRFVEFGGVSLIDYNGNLNRYDPRLTTDVALSYALTNQLRLSVGSSNLFNKYPNFFNPQATETGGAWDPVQMGSNGRFLFAKLQARF